MADKPGIRRVTQAGIDNLAGLLCRLAGTNCLLQPLISTGACRQPATRLGFWRSGRSRARSCFCREKLQTPGTFLADAHQDRNITGSADTGILPVQRAEYRNYPLW